MIAGLSRTQLTLCLLVLFALSLRVLGPLDSGLWFDEIWTLVDFGRLPLGTLITTFGTDNNHPLYSLCAWFSLHAFGESAAALRLPALVFGVASIGMLYVYACRVTTPREALIGTLLLCTSYHHVWFSQNARGYTMLLFFTLASTHFFEELLDGRKNTLFPYALTLALGMYAHLTAIFVALAHAAVYAHVLFWKKEREARPPQARLWPLYGLLLGAALTLALHAPLLADMVTFFTQPGGGHGKVKSQWTSPLWTLAEIARSLGFGLLPGAVLLLSSLVVLGAGTLSYAKQSLPRALLFILPGAFGALVMIGLHRHLWPRFFFFQAGFIVLIVVRGLVVSAQRLSRFAPAAAVERTERTLFRLALGVLALAWLAILPRAYTLPKQDYEGAQRYVESVRKPGEVVLTTGLAAMPYARYYRSDFISVKTVPELEQALHGTTPATGAYALSTLPTFLDSRAPELSAWLAAHAHEVKRLPGSVGDGDLIVLRLDL